MFSSHCHLRFTVLVKLISLCFIFLTNNNAICQSAANFEQSYAPDGSKRRVYTTQRTTTSPVIDGILDDEEWKKINWSSDFTQIRPADGEDPTSQTSFKILFDDKYLYVAIRCHDDEPDKIVKRMSRRDGFEGDWVEINIDSYHDLRTAFSFTVSVSGVKGDELVSLDGNNWDTSWNPIWDTKTNIDDEGWTAEFRIPLSQLRFDPENEQVWGLQFNRRDFRNESRSSWQYIPQNSGYWVSGFGELHGLKGVSPKRQVELQPYVLAQNSLSKPVEGHPFRDGSESKFTGGLDGKIGVTNDLTLDFTVNPDFGQVEADPSVIVLDGFEVFFQERRPFFVENRNIFNYQISNPIANGNYSSDNLFYSRRIGASPQGILKDKIANSEFADIPDFTSILGAAKFSGKTSNRLSIGVLESVTQREKATVIVGEDKEEVIVEPLTNYAMMRFQQDINEGNTVIGGIITAVNREDDSSFNFLHRQAYSGGFDLLHQWNERQWRINASLVVSQMRGSMESITSLQRNFVHAFDREGAQYLSVDTSATALSGTGGNVSIGRFGNRLRFEFGATWRSPGLELNDIGFLRNADEINQYLWVGYQWVQPFSIFRSLSVNFNEFARFDFGGQLLGQSFSCNTNAVFTNFWSLNMGFGVETNDKSNRWLRGGPTFRKPHGFGGNINIGTDRRKKVSMNVGFNGGGGFDGSVRNSGINAGIFYQATNALNISLATSWSKGFREDQYVQTSNVESRNRYILGEINQRTLSFTGRVNFNITPDLTIQYYGQPFISRGLYSDFKYVNDPLNLDPKIRMVSYGLNQIAYVPSNRVYRVDDMSNGIFDFDIQNPNFEFIQFRSNLVLRWEYKPGSELFLVWTQGSTNFFSVPEDNLINDLTGNIFNEELVNTFLVKMTYRFAN